MHADVHAEQARWREVGEVVIEAFVILAVVLVLALWCYHRCRCWWERSGRG